SASLAPDLDRFLLLPLREQLLPLGPAGPLHSLLGGALVAVVLFLVARPLVPPEGRRAAGLLVGWAVTLHLAADALTADGLPLLWPLATERFGLAWLARFDAWLWFLLGAPLLRDLLRLRRRRGKLHLAAVRSGLIPLFALYLGICGVTKLRAIQAAHRSVPSSSHVEEVQAYPLAPGPFAWT